MSHAFVVWLCGEPGCYTEAASEKNMLIHQTKSGHRDAGWNVVHRDVPARVPRRSPKLTRPPKPQVFAWKLDLDRVKQAHLRHRDAVSVARAARQMADLAQDAFLAEVELARCGHATLQQIGDVLGLSRQRVHQLLGGNRAGTREKVPEEVHERAREAS